MPDLPHLSVDRVSRTAYLRLRAAPVADTEEAIPSTVLLDRDADGIVIGVEVINLPAEFDPEDLLARYRFRPEDIAAVRALPGQLRGRVSIVPSISDTADTRRDRCGHRTAADGSGTAPGF